MHEFVCRGAIEGTGVRALDVSKRLLDYGFHPPTNYFPLIVPEALMIEPTETEASRRSTPFVEAMKAIAKEAHTDPLWSGLLPTGRLSGGWTRSRPHANSYFRTVPPLPTWTAGVSPAPSARKSGRDARGPR